MFRRPRGVVALLLVGLAAIASPAAQTIAIDTPAMLRDLRLLSADDMEGREVGTPGGAKARALLVDRFGAVGLKPFGDSFEQPFTFGGLRRRQGVNVVGHVTGTRTPERYIVVSAHYDHLGVRNGRTFNGANDNASGAAALAAIAEHFVQHPPAASIIFAAFDAEESGLQGSRAFVRAPPVDPSAILFNLNLDMIGRDPANTLYVIGTYRYPALRPLVERVAGTAPVTLRMGYDDPRQGRDRDWTRDSDHWSFMDAGIPALYLGVEDFALHHNADDDYETMTLDFYARAVEAIVQLIEAADRDVDAIASLRR